MGAASERELSSAELMVDLIISLDGCASAEGWPGWWGLEGPEYLAWLEEEGQKDRTYLLGANTYRLMSGMSEEARGFPRKKGRASPAWRRCPRLCFPPRSRGRWAGRTRSWSAGMQWRL